MRAGRGLADASASRYRAWLVETILGYRSRWQARDLIAATRVVAISSFAKHLSRDRGVDLSRITVMPNPIDVDRLEAVASGGIP